MKIALVTGGAIRVGKAVAETLAAAGYRIAIHYRSSDGDARALQARLAHSTIHQADLTDLPAIETLAQSVAETHGRINVLVNSAADYFPTPLGTVTPAQWEQLHALNLRAPFFLSQAVKPFMPAGGCIVNITDAGGDVPHPDYIPYGSSKAGLVAVTEGLARALGPAIRVNAVAPGPVIHPPHYTEAQRRASIEKTLLKREGSPEDIARAVRFLVENDYITGVVLPVDGGRRLA
jgi:pteridine reductase